MQPPPPPPEDKLPQPLPPKKPPHAAFEERLPEQPSNRTQVDPLPPIGLVIAESAAPQQPEVPVGLPLTQIQSSTFDPMPDEEAEPPTA